MSGKKILVACQDLDYILINKILLVNYSLVKAEWGKEFIQRAEHEDYDLYLVDISFFYSDSVVVEKLKRTLRPILVLSSELSDAFAKKVIEKGYSDCYVKPIRREAFNKIIRRWTGMS